MEIDSESSLISVRDEFPITGHFRIDFNHTNSYGYFHDRPLQDGEMGLESILTWFELLVEATLAISKENFVLLDVIESNNTWIQFVKVSADEIDVSIIKATKQAGGGFISTSPLDQYEYGEWKNIRINERQFKNELVTKAKQFVGELESINKIFLVTTPIVSLLEKLGRL